MWAKCEFTGYGVKCFNYTKFYTKILFISGLKLSLGKVAKNVGYLVIANCVFILKHAVLTLFN